MKKRETYQIVISGVGGQGVLFITRLLAEAALHQGLSVFTSETHGMAQRGGTVISHLKVGPFASPLIVPGRADGLIALKAENLVQHGGYLKPDGWAVVNSPVTAQSDTPSRLFCLDADRLAQAAEDSRSLNLIMLGFTLSDARGTSGRRLHCTLEEIAAVLKNRLKDRPRLLQASLRALQSGARSAPAASCGP